MEVENKGKLKPHQVGEDIAFMPFNKLFDYFNCKKEDVVWCSFNMKDLVPKRTKGLRIWTKKEYTIFTSIISKLDVKKTVYLRLANSKEDNKVKKKDLLAK